jgi:hypothetical protein
MCCRINAALIESNMDKLGGIVEVDETYIGHVRGRSARNRANIIEAREGTLVRMHRRASRVLEAFIDESIRVSVGAQHHPTIFQGMRYRHGTLEAIERLMRGGEIESGLRS